MIIEDDPAVGRSLRAGYSVTWKASGAEGVSFARD